MCNVCCAEKAMDAASHERVETFRWRDEPEKGRLSLEARRQLPFAGAVVVDVEGTAAEFTPARLRVKREGDSTWSDWIETQDLASSLGALGVDVRWPFVHDTVKAWLAGGDFEPVRVRMARGGIAAGPEDRRAFRASQRARAKLQRERRDRRAARVLTLLGPGWSYKGGTRGFRSYARFTHVNSATVTLWGLGFNRKAKGLAKYHGRLAYEGVHVGGELQHLITTFNCLSAKMHAGINAASGGIEAT